MGKQLPGVQEIQRELYRERYKIRYRQILRSTLYALIIVAAISVLVATFLLPVLEIYGDSMYPTLKEGQIVVSVKTRDFRRGDVIAFYYNNRILVKRIVGTAGERIFIDDSGTVYINNEEYEESYLEDGTKSLGDSNIEYPCTVEEETFFVLGDNRETSVDSRNSTIGCVSTDDVVGKIVFVLWPLSSFGVVH